MKLTAKYESGLLEYLYSALAPQSRTGIKAILKQSRIEVNGKVTTAFDFRLKAGDIINILEKAAAVKGCSDRRVEIVFEDRWLIVINKKEGLPTISTGRENEDTAYSILTSYVRQSGPGNRVFIVHRIDRDTSGLLVFAKDEGTKQMLQTGWNENITERKYVGVAEGPFSREDGKVISWLKENPKLLKMSSSPVDNGGQKAITSYKVLGYSNGLSMLELELETGRKNQIRIQLASIGHPLAGDKKYGAESNPFGRLALHAKSIAFIHPHTGKAMRFDTPNPFRF